MATLHTRGVDFFYEDIGRGPTVIVLHGLLGSVSHTERFGMRAEQLARHGLRVISCDARGHGRSGFTTRAADYTWPELADDLAAFVAKLGLESVSVYGTSLGAGCALLFALAQPKRVARLILRSPPPFEAALGAARRRLGLLSFAYRHWGVRWTGRLLGWGATLANPRRGAAQRALFGEPRAAAIVPAIQGLLFDGPQLPSERLAEISAPTLLLAHPADRLHPLSSCEILHRELRHATLEVAPSASHWRERPAALAERIARFILGS